MKMIHDATIWHDEWSEGNKIPLHSSQNTDQQNNGVSIDVDWNGDRKGNATYDKCMQH
jgi:hypothetical protein